MLGMWGVDLASAVKATAHRDSLRLLPQMPLYQNPPTVTLSAAGAATGLTGATVYVAGNDVRFRYSSCDHMGGTSGWYWMGINPVGNGNDQGAPYCVDWLEDSADFEILLAGQAANRGYKVWIDGQPLSATTQAGPGATGDTHRLRVTFGSRLTRHVRVLTNAGFVGVTHHTIDTIVPATRPLYSQRVYFLGDSFTAGSGTTYQQDGFVNVLADKFGWEALNGGELGTGYVAVGSNGGASYLSRATADVVPTNPDAVVIYGGTNDLGASPSAVRASAKATYAALAAALPGVPVYVFGVQYPSGVANTQRDVLDTVIAAEASAAPNVVMFRSVKAWITGSGNAGTPAADGNADALTSSDGLHPTLAGHAYLAARMAAEITPLYTAV